MRVTVARSNSAEQYSRRPGQQGGQGQVWVKGRQRGCRSSSGRREECKRQAGRKGEREPWPRESNPPGGVGLGQWQGQGQASVARKRTQQAALPVLQQLQRQVELGIHALHPGSGSVPEGAFTLCCRQP